jgi:hypothetical protein
VTEEKQKTCSLDTKTSDSKLSCMLDCATGTEQMGQTGSSDSNRLQERTL